MEEIREINHIVLNMSPRERKSARKYLQHHYSNTKELKLFDLVEKFNAGCKMDIRREITEMGYPTTTSKSFQKLRGRLKKKLFDFLLTSSAIEGSRMIDENLFIKQRLRKINLQANILLEKSFLNQSSELLINNVRMARDHGQYDEMIDAMCELKKIHEIRANYSKREKIIHKIAHYRKIIEQTRRIEAEFTKILLKMDTDHMDYLPEMMNSQISAIREEKKIRPSRQLDCMEDYLALCLHHDDLSNEDALYYAFKWLKIFRNNPIRHDMAIKLAFFKSLIEILFSLRRNGFARKLLETSGYKELPLHQRFGLEMLRVHHAIVTSNLPESEQLLDALKNDLMHIGKMELIFHYYSAFHEFIKGNCRKSLNIIDQNIRSFSCASVHQLDLMVLELMTLFEMEKLDLLEYKIQGFAKNVSYRKKFLVPLQYQLISKLFNNLLRSNFNFSDTKVQELQIEIVVNPPSGLLRTRSLLSDMFNNWYGGKIRTTNPGSPDAPSAIPSSLLHALY